MFFCVVLGFFALCVLCNGLFVPLSLCECEVAAARFKLINGTERSRHTRCWEGTRHDPQGIRGQIISPSFPHLPLPKWDAQGVLVQNMLFQPHSDICSWRRESSDRLGELSPISSSVDSSSQCCFPPTLWSRAPQGVRTNATWIGADVPGDDVQAGGSGEKKQSGEEK